MIGRRVALRPLTTADAPALLEAARASREALRRRLSWAGVEPTLDGETAFVAAAAGWSQAGTARVWGVFEAKDNALAGVASLSELDAADRGSARLAVWVRTGRTDKGFATEAGKLALEFAFKGLELRRLTARLDPANRAFRRVLKKLGFRYEGCLRAERRLNGRWVDQECWGLLRTDRAPAKAPKAGGRKA